MLKTETNQRFLTFVQALVFKVPTKQNFQFLV